MSWDDLLTFDVLKKLGSEGTTVQNIIFGRNESQSGLPLPPMVDEISEAIVVTKTTPKETYTQSSRESNSSVNPFRNRGNSGAGNRFSQKAKQSRERSSESQ